MGAGTFGHREHLLLAWQALEASPDLTTAQRVVSDTVMRISQAHGVPQHYNRTVTDAWVCIVAHCRAIASGATFDELLERFPWLLDKRLLLRHYSSRVLASEAARRSWVPPDVQPIPVGAA